MLCVLSITSLQASAEGVNTTDVPMRPVKHSTGGNGGASRMPSACPVTVIYDNVTCELYFYSTSVVICSYYVYDEDEMLLTQDSLDFTNTNIVSVSLSDYENDYYIIQLEIDGTLYEGYLEM